VAVAERETGRPFEERLPPSPSVPGGVHWSHGQWPSSGRVAETPRRTRIADGCRLTDGIADGCRLTDGISDGCRLTDGIADGCRLTDGIADGCRLTDGISDGCRLTDGISDGCRLTGGELIDGTGCELDCELERVGRGGSAALESIALCAWMIALRARLGSSISDASDCRDTGERGTRPCERSCRK
jgi:hypothetical protein